MQSPFPFLRYKYRAQITSPEHGPSRVPSVAEWLRGCAPSPTSLSEFSPSLFGARRFWVQLPPTSIHPRPHPTTKKLHLPIYISPPLPRADTTTRNKNTYTTFTTSHLLLPTSSPSLHSLSSSTMSKRASANAAANGSTKDSTVGEPGESSPPPPHMRNSTSQGILYQKCVLFAFQFNSIQFKLRLTMGVNLQPSRNRRNSSTRLRATSR
jgi:hypothetical protein